MRSRQKILDAVNRYPKVTLKLALLLILLVAFALRVVNLTGVPPGLTHDEANHGREGIAILDGDLRLYYPLNYGSEPLYSYLVAGSMGLLGENLFALRLVGVLFGVLLVAAVYRFSADYLNGTIALYAAGILAVAYWPLVASRMALRATLLPFWMMMAVIGIWAIWLPNRQKPVWWSASLILFVLGVSGMWYTYLASRVLWGLFPLFWLGLLLLYRRSAASPKREGLFLLLGLGLSALLITPMFVYLTYFPESSTRLGMLDGPIQQALEGNFGPMFANISGALAALFWPGAGDSFLAYNIPGRPVLSFLLAPFFLIGIAVSLWRWRRPAYLFLPVWLAVGLIPSLITGPTANTTRNVGALPVIYILTAVGLHASIDWAIQRFLPETKSDRMARPLFHPLIHLLSLLAVTTLLLTLTVRSYHFLWPNLPDVRGAYQTTIIAALDKMERDLAADPTDPALVSSLFPGPAHDPSIALVMLQEKERPLRWMDGRFGLVIPAGTEPLDLYAPASAPLHPFYAERFELVETVPTRPDDLDPSFSHYRLLAGGGDAFPLDPTFVPQMFGQEGLVLEGADWRNQTVSPGDVVELVTRWRVIDPTQVGPIVWPIETTDILFFTQILRPDGTILVQADRLDAPSWGWQAEDTIFQIHQMSVPPDAAPGPYRVIVGVYDRQSGDRLPNLSTPETADFADVPALEVR